MNDIYKYKALFDTFPDGLIVLDSHGKIVLVNEKTETLFGYGKVGLIGKGIDILIPERFNKNIFEQLANFISTPRVIVKGTEKDFYGRKKDGTEFAIEITINLVQLESGNFVSIAISEITKLKKIELLLAEAQKKSFESQKLFSKIFHFSPVPIILSRLADGLLLDVNLAFLNLTGFTLDDLKERTVSDSGIFIESEKRKNVLTSIRKSYQLQNIETTIKTKFGKKLNGIATTSLVVINEEECVISSFADITERKEASLKVKSLSSIIENSLNEILIFDRESLKIVFANKKVLKNIGYSKREIEQLTVVDLKPEFTRELYFKKIDPLLSGEVELISFETIHRRKDGTIYSVEVQVQLSEYDGRKTFTGINLDITTHKKENIKTLQYSQAIEQNPASIVITDTTGNIEYVNPRFLETTGYSKGEVMGKNPRILKSGYTSSSDYASLWKQILSGNIWQGELQNVTKSGELYWEQVIISPILNEKGEIINFIAIKENITKRIQIEQELRESERFLKETQLIANLGTYSLDFITDKWSSSMLLNNIFGIEADFDRSIKGWLSIIHPEWQKELFNYLRDEVIGKNKSFDKEYKIIRKDDNAERWVHGVGSLKFNHGKLLSMVGTIQDIT
ncbi:MAG: PAS domain S-box protein, partial [Bacteroidetes bacterium]|nr:PAS domain S-box protein [Bacteroidota bacterium]